VLVAAWLSVGGSLGDNRGLLLPGVVVEDVGVVALVHVLEVVGDDVGEPVGVDDEVAGAGSES